MQPISFILCNYNTPDYFQFCYESLRKNLSPEHEIVLLDDGSSDETSRTWMRGLSDPNVVCIENHENVGIAYSYNTAIDAAKNELVCVLHTDMYVPPGFDQAMVRGMKNHDFICAYRAEPDLSPPSPDKAIADFGMEIGRFDESGFLAWNAVNGQINAGRTSKSMFFPWMTRRDFFASIGGVDLLFLKYMVDDDDLYLRTKLAGARMAQVMDAAVYHFGSRSTRFAGDDISAQLSPAWEQQFRRSHRNFVRKWGRHASSFWTESMEIVVRHKYDIGIVVPGTGLEMLHALEPWAANIYIDDPVMRKEYLAIEGHKSMLNLAERVRLLSRGGPENDVVLELSELGEGVMDMVRNLPEFLDRLTNADSGIALDTYNLSCGATLTVNRLENREQEQAVNPRRFAYKRGLSERAFRVR